MASPRAIQVYPGVWVSGQEFAKDLEKLQSYNIKYVLIVAQDIPAYFPEELIYRRKPILDMPTEDLLAIVKPCCGFIEKGKQEGRGVLVQCVSGISRSVAVVSSYIMAKEKMSYDEAISDIRLRYEEAEPNEGFVKQLRVLEARLRVQWKKEEEKKAEKQRLEDEKKRKEKEAEMEKEALAEGKGEVSESEGITKEKEVDEKREVSNADAENGRKKGVTFSLLKEEATSSSSSSSLSSSSTSSSTTSLFASSTTIASVSSTSSSSLSSPDANLGVNSVSSPVPGVATAGCRGDKNTQFSVHHLASPQEWFRCRACRFPLFIDSDISEKHNDSITDGSMGYSNKSFRGKRGQRATERICSSYFIEKMEWMAAEPMNNLEENEGKLHCPKCQARLGTWHWDGGQCSCGKWCTPAIQVVKGKVDNPIV